MSRIFDCYIQNADGSDRIYLPIKNFSFRDIVNTIPTGSLTVNYAEIKSLADTHGKTVRQFFGAQYKEIYIEDTASSTVQGIFFPQFIRSAVDRGGVEVIDVPFKGILGLLEKRFTNYDTVREYQDQDLSDIAWDLINYTQTLSTTGADFGITRGADPTTRDADRTYNREQIFHAIEGLSNARVKNGIDFDIDNSRQFNVYYPEKGQQRDNIILTEGHNMTSRSFSQPLISEMANEVTAVGEGSGMEAPYATKTSVDTYKNLFYLLQEVITAKDVSILATLEDKAQVYLDDFKYPRNIISASHFYNSPSINDYSVGDTIKVVSDKWDVDGYYRILGREIKYDGYVELIFDIK